MGRNEAVSNGLREGDRSAGPLGPATTFMQQLRAPTSSTAHAGPDDLLGKCSDSSSGGGSSSVIDLVLHTEPPAYLEPEVASEIVAVMEAGVVERHLGCAVLEGEPEELRESLYGDRLVLLQFN